MKPKKNPPSAPQTVPAPTHEQITQLAHTLWLEEGKPEGRELHHWLEAERRLRAGGARPSSGGEKALTRGDVESDKRVDGLGAREREPRTPKGERL